MRAGATRTALKEAIGLAEPPADEQAFLEFLGASHQTGWTGLVAKLIQLFGLLDAQKLPEAGKAAAFVRGRQGGDMRK